MCIQPVLYNSEATTHKMKGSRESVLFNDTIKHHTHH